MRMRKKSRKIPFFPLFILILIFSLILNLALLVKSYRGNLVVAVPDGDSLDLANGQRVRLLAIDAPEKGRCLADEARNKLRDLALGKHVRLKNTVTDDYGRTLANVIREDFSGWVKYLRWWFATRLKLPNPPAFQENYLNRALVRDGLARFEHVKNEYYTTLKAADDEAKAQQLGIYSSRCRNLAPPGQCQVKGNLRAGLKQYYLPGCREYTQVIVDEAYGDQWFCSESEAQSAGFSPASSCK